MPSPRSPSSPGQRARTKFPVAMLGAVAVALLGAPGALANSVRSSNWAGYAVHRQGISFTQVRGAWRQPGAVCTAGQPTYSSAWVGLGGYSLASTALEQIGSEVDCSATGRVLSSVWYELVPAASRTIRMKVVPGDELSASVTVTGHRVRLTLRDLTRRSSFTRTLHASTVDVSSADWIVEAPSQCAGVSSCQSLALADFATASFARAHAVTTTSHRGAIADSMWHATRIALTASARQFIGRTGAPSSFSASPSPLSADGSAFTVTYLAAPTTAALARSYTPLMRPIRSSSTSRASSWP